VDRNRTTLTWLGKRRNYQSRIKQPGAWSK